MTNLWQACCKLILLSGYLLENQENSDMEIDGSDIDPDYVATEDGSDSDKVDYGFHLEVNICLLLYFRPLQHPSVLMLNPRIMDCLIKPTFGHLSND
ncbi:hypothetical protein AVEN_259150-1 [Araneus ventricosus]|uniref:Uncharacterized protein n=1 Tax=Araneus ventricosus TaxID=182803 RepID=A0A4Y2JSL4_ARAVE|nr:hypothetical protein AVEN_259150-1 [Araneus ventricosus]